MLFEVCGNFLCSLPLVRYYLGMLLKRSLVLILVLLAGCASTGPSPDDQYFTDTKRELLNLWDVSSDGTITCDDVDRLKRYRFAYSDSNNDGLLTLAEMNPAPWAGGDNASETHEKLDSNGDGSVSRDEFMLNASPEFTELDGNNDCTVTDQEIRDYVGIR